MLKNKMVNEIYNYLNEDKKQLNINLSNDYSVKFLAQGEYNINFIIQDKNKKWVFRVNTASQLELDNQIRYEYNALKTLEISRVTPKVYFVDDTKKSFNYGVLIMEFLEGVPLSYERDLMKAAGIFSKIHSIDTKDIAAENFVCEDRLFSSRIEEAERLLKNFIISDKAPYDLKAFFNEFLNYADINRYKEKFFLDNEWRVINNTETNSNNFIIGRDRSYLIDWEKPVISDPCQDLTQFLAPTTTLWKTDYILSRDERKAFIKEYVKNLEGGFNDIEERIELYTPYLYLRALSWCAFAYLEYLKPGREIRNEDTFNKIIQYLDMGFIKKLLDGYFKF